MKERFLELVEEVELTGIVETLRKTSKEEEMSIEWNKFLDENYNLCLRIADWAIDFDDAPQAIFKRGEEIENPLEIVAIIRIIGDKRVSETQIFEEWDELLTAVRNINDSFAVAVAACIESDYIFLITAESIFSKKEDV